MIRLSSGTAAFLGLQNNRMDFFPTTAYLFSGESCQMSCSFCPQGKGGSQANGRLGRINWPEFSWTEIAEPLRKASEKGLERICLQSVRDKESTKPLLTALSRLTEITNLPISLSAWVDNQVELGQLFNAGVDRASLSLDVANPDVYKKLKGGSFQKRLALLLNCAEQFPGKMSTHIICGLGESEEEILSLADKLLRSGVTIALFAFVPLKNTELAFAKPPSVLQYRRIQAGLYLLRNGITVFSQFVFHQGQLVSYGLNKHDLRNILFDGSAFQTSGCPGCNRPYYNERPGGIIYNYHYRLATHEAEHAIREVLDSLA